jgi:hypothetical protein
MNRINFDALGIIASLACAVHCAVLPLLLSSLPLFGINIIHNLWFETGMILLALLVGILALRHGAHIHHQGRLPVTLFVAGITLLFVKQFVPHRYLLFFLVPAVVLIVSAHLINYRQCRLSPSGKSTSRKLP